MTALLAYLAVTVVTSTVVVLMARRTGPPSARGTPWDLADNARKQVTVLAGLTGFATTNIVLLVTFASNRAEVRSDAFNSLVALLVVAYFNYVSTGLMFATIVRGGDDGDAAVQGLQYALTTTQLYRGIFLGWLAIAPLLETFALERLATFTTGLLLLAVLGGWVYQATSQVRLGYLHLWAMALGPALAFVASGLATAAIRRSGLDAPSPDSVMYLAGAAFVLGAISFLANPLAGLASDYRGTRAGLLAHAHLAVAAHAQATVVLLAFIWLAVAGLI